MYIALYKRIDHVLTSMLMCSDVQRLNVKTVCSTVHWYIIYNNHQYLWNDLCLSESVEHRVP